MTTATLAPPTANATATVPAADGAPVVDAAAVAAFHRDGFLSLPALTTADEAVRLRALYDDLFARRVGRESGDQFDLFGDDQDPDRPKVPQILGPERFAPELLETTAWRNARALLTALLGGEPAGMGSHMILKPAGSPMATPWHQDEAYWDPSWHHTGISIWIPLQDVDRTSGCMHFIPGSHRRGIVRHRSGNNDPRVHGLEIDDDAQDLTSQVACPLPAGGCTAHGPRTLHYTSPNQAAVPRRAWIITGGLHARPRAEIRRFPWLEAKKTLREERAKAFRERRADA